MPQLMEDNKFYAKIQRSLQRNKKRNKVCQNKKITETNKNINIGYLY